MVLLPGTQYSNGQAFDIPNVVIEAHKVGAYAGFDLAAVVGDMELSLHDWNVDFAVWAHYKYLNGGLGSVGGAFIHRKIFIDYEKIIAIKYRIPHTNNLRNTAFPYQLSIR